MGGFNEQCAKAFCLALMRIALADNRRCFVTCCSSEVVHYELTSESGLEQAIRFLSQRFRGGTDPASCFAPLLNVCKTAVGGCGCRGDPDLLPNGCRMRVIAQWGAVQRKHQHFASRGGDVGSMANPRTSRIFDHIWRFDTGLL